MMFEKNCARCGVSLVNHVAGMSYFNTDVCCLDCLEKERQHPDYQRARQVELEEVRRGNYNFEGIGKPADL